MLLTTTLAATFLFAQQNEPKYSEIVYMLDISGSTDVSQAALRGLALDWTRNQIDYYGEGNVRISLLTFGYLDGKARVTTFTKSPDVMIRMLAGNLINAGNTKEKGSDTAMLALKSLDWTSGPAVKRTLMVMGNESLRQSKGAIPLEDVASKAIGKHIMVDTVFSPFHPVAGSSKDWEELAQLSESKFHLLTESDLETYTALYDRFHDGVERELWMQQDRKAKQQYLDQLLRKRIG